MYEVEFRLNEFKALGKWLDELNWAPPIIFLIKAYLWGLEELLINQRIKNTLDRAEADYRRSQPPLVELKEPNHYTEPSDVEGLDTIGYSYGFTRTRTKDTE